MSEEKTQSRALIRYVNRQQMSWRAVDVDKLIEEDHPARAIWLLVGRLDLSRFYASIQSSADEGGRPAYDPQLLVADGSYTTRDNLEKMAEREIDFLGSMGREELSSGTTAPNRLPPSAFVYHAETNRYVC